MSVPTQPYDPYDSFEAYLTPGWTAQNMAYPPAVLVPEPVLPQNLHKVALTHTYLRADGKANGGNVRVRRSARSEVDGVSIGPFDVRTSLVRGVLAVTVLTTTDEAWEYEVYEAFPGGQSYRIAVPVAETSDIRALRLDDDHGADGTPDSAAAADALAALVARVAALEAPTENEQSFVFTQEPASTDWVIDHGLPFRPAAIDVYDPEGNRHYPDVSWPTDAQIRLSFSTPVAGVATIS